MFVLYLCFLLLVSHFPLLFVLSSSLCFSLSFYISMYLLFYTPCFPLSMCLCIDVYFIGPNELLQINRNRTTSAQCTAGLHRKIARDRK
uniref:Uncharacterized protein n=1 Tax=Anopheles darlingi TaxID=43151 RepID=A0A2M4D0P5_ANODA